MMVMILFGFSTFTYAMAPTSENGLGVEQLAFRELSSTVWDSKMNKADIFEFLRVEDDLGLIFRIGKLNEFPMEWKVLLPDYQLLVPMLKILVRKICHSNAITLAANFDPRRKY